MIPFITVYQVYRHQHSDIGRKVLVSSGDVEVSFRVVDFSDLSTPKSKPAQRFGYSKSLKYNFPRTGVNAYRLECSIYGRPRWNKLHYPCEKKIVTPKTDTFSSTFRAMYRLEWNA